LLVRFEGGPFRPEVEQFVREPVLVLNYIHVLIAMVEVGEGIAIEPSYAVLACRNRRFAMSRLINPVVHFDFYQIRQAGQKLSPIADEFTSFLPDHLSSRRGNRASSKQSVKWICT
jgi:DNA-binding transcriptional LysR family regulator